MSLCVQLHLKHKHVLIVGGGKVAYRKAIQFQQEGAILTIVSPYFIDEFQNHEFIFIKREYQTQDVKNQFYVYAATDDHNVNQKILKDAQVTNIISGCAIKHELVSTNSMYTIETQGMLSAFSTLGTYPAYYSEMKDEWKLWMQVHHEKLAYLQEIRNYVITHPLIDSKVLKTIVRLSKHDLRFIRSALQTQRCILLAFHGVAKRSILLNLYQECADLEQCDNQHAYGLVYLSEKVCEKLSNQVMNLQTIFEILKALCIDNIMVCPMLMNKGKYYNQLSTICTQANVRFCDPLLNDKETIEYMIDAYIKQYHHGEQLIFVTHDHYPTEIMTLMNLSVNRYEHVFIQSFDETIEYDKRVRIKLIPFVMLLGYHAQKDILEGALSLYARLYHHDYEVDIIQTCVFDQEFIREFYREKFKKV